MTTNQTREARLAEWIMDSKEVILHFGGAWRGAALIDILGDIYGFDKETYATILDRYSSWIEAGVNPEMLIDNLLPQVRYDSSEYDNATV